MINDAKSSSLFFSLGMYIHTYTNIYRKFWKSAESLYWHVYEILFLLTMISNTLFDKMRFVENIICEPSGRKIIDLKISVGFDNYCSTVLRTDNIIYILEYDYF